MKLTSVELIRIKIPMRTVFRTSFGSEQMRSVLLIHVVGPDAEGWGECVAGEGPLYSSEYADGADAVTRRFLLPRLASMGDINAASLGEVLAPIKGHRMSKGALEMAVLDAELRAAGVSFAQRLGATKDRVPSGVSVGIMESIQELLDVVEGFVAEGYLRIKLKIEPGWDVDAVRAVRERFGDILLQVDANTAYTLGDARHLAKLDDFDLVLIEQPLPEDDLLGHAKLVKQLRTPICLDESITSSRAAADAIALGACSIVNIKPGRVGGYLEAVRVHDVCVAQGVPVWCGGMLETGIGRAANVALAALPGFTLPGDTSASGRYYETDITEPFVLDQGHVAVPRGPGLGVVPIPEILEGFLDSRETVSL